METSDAFLAELADLADACEQSWSISAEEIEERVLFFCDANVATSQAIARSARALGMHDHMLKGWAAAIPGADAIGLALRCDRKSVRLYTQYWLAITARVHDGNRTPFPLYCGFKSLPGNVTRKDDYICTPVAPPEVFWPPMSDSFAATGLDANQAVDVFRNLNAETAIFTQTSGHERTAWLTTVRRAKIPRDALAELLAPIAHRPGGDAVIAAARNTDLVHVAGGTDNVKGHFLSLYFESDPTTVLERLS